MNTQQLNQMKNALGFIAALDQSGGSSPKALEAYGVRPDEYATEDEMYDKIHEMRTRIMTAPVFNGDKILAAILFENTMERTVNGKPTAQYLWEDRRIVPFLKIDKGLENIVDDVQILKPIPGLDHLLEKAKTAGIFGTKMRSLITQANKTGIARVVTQQFELAQQIQRYGLVPIIEPEVSIAASDKADAEINLKALLTTQLEAIKQPVILKLTLPTHANFYRELVEHPKVIRVVALSGGYSRQQADTLLAQNNGLIASFSRALTEGLKVSQSDAEFNQALTTTVDAIYTASVTKTTTH